MFLVWEFFCHNLPPAHFSHNCSKYREIWVCSEKTQKSIKKINTCTKYILALKMTKEVLNTLMEFKNYVEAYTE